MKIMIIVWCACLFCSSGASSQTRHGATSSFTSYKGLMMTGYQGWFNAPGDGAGRGWNHYRKNNAFLPGSANVEMWPAVDEYSKTYRTGFLKADGRPAYVFSSYDASTVELHFKWMQQYGIDGAFVQRFVTNLKELKGLNANNVVLQHVIRSSEKFGRAFSVMYDLSGMNVQDDKVIIEDWKHLVDSLKITSRGSSQKYLYHNGKPLVAIWGVGFNDGRRYDIDCVRRLLEFFKSDPVYGGCAVLLGVPTFWRDFGRDTEKDPRLHELIRQADIVHPWMVGRFSEANMKEYVSRIQGDIAWCKENRVDYVPVVYPGFSWHNMNPGSKQDQVPRNRGSFFWKLMTGAIANGAEMLYVAMFDEIDEGTAIFKIDKAPPVGITPFLTFENDVPSDLYLYLTGQGGRMLRKEIPLDEHVPSKPKNTHQ